MKLIINIILAISLFSCSESTSTPEELGAELLTAFKNDDIKLIESIGWTFDEVIKTAENSDISQQEIDNLKSSGIVAKVDLRDFIGARKEFINNSSDSSIKNYSITDCYVKIKNQNGIEGGKAIIKVENNGKNAQFIGYEIVKIYNGNWKLQDDIWMADESTIDDDNYIKYRYYETLKKNE